MAHGHPDYGAAAPATTIYTIQDMAEFAARLGSIVTFDRRGNVIWLDDFESGIEKWYRSDPGAGASCTWSQEKARSGGFSTKLVTPNIEGTAMLMRHREPYPVLSKLGLEFSLLHYQYIKWLEIYFRLYDGTTEYNSGIQCYGPAGPIKYYGAGPGWHAITPTHNFIFDHELFHTFKLVVDFTTNKYVRFIFDELSCDLTAYSLYQTGFITNPRIQVEISIYTNCDDHAIGYLDDVILTQNEP